MEAVNLTEISARREDIEQSDIEAVLGAASARECWAYSTVLFRRASDQSCPEPERSVLVLLGAFASMELKPRDADEPFGPLAVIGGSRTATVDDFATEQLQALNEALPSLSDAELRARIADVIWLRLRDHNAGRLAVEAYLESASRLEDPEKWTAAADRITRALQVAASLGRKAGCYRKVIEHIENVLAKYKGEDPLFLSVTLMELLLDYGEGDPGTYAPLALKLAQRSDAAGDYYRARMRWEIAARWFNRAKDDAGERDCRRRFAETFVREAERAVAGDSPSYTMGAHHLQGAIAAYRRVSDTRARVEELHHLLLTYQERSVRELKPIGASIDISEMVDVAVRSVRGKSLQDALIAFALVASSPRVDDLKKRVEESVARFPLQHLFQHVLLSEKGKVTAKKAGVSRGEQGDEDALRQQMFEDAKQHQALVAQGAIEPCRHALNEEHRFTRATFTMLGLASPLVPPGREDIWARGLMAGMSGDYLVAAHILVPQIEHGVRWLLQQRGMITSGLDQDGIQEEFDLNRILRSSDHVAALEAALGRDAVFDLRGLLVERTGSNLRNMVAHGLLASQQFFTAPVCYFWWLVLRLAVLGMLAVQKRSEGA